MKTIEIKAPEGYEIDKEQSTFERIVFKKKNKLPEKWEDLIGINGLFASVTFKDEEQLNASFALAKLSQLLYIYNDGWKPDWNNDERKYVIDTLIMVPYQTISGKKYLAFKEREKAELFLNNFKDLIEQAKIFI